MTDHSAGDQLRAARQALAAARAAARARGARPDRPSAEPVREAADGSVRQPAEGAGPGDDARNPTGRESVITGQSGRSGAVPGSPAGRDRSTGQASGRPGFETRPQPDDPVLLSAAIGGLLDAEGWALAVATGSVFGRWAQIVGADLAGHTTPESLSDGVLTVVADSTAWATQVRLLAAQLVHRLNRELGDGTVLRVQVRGPAVGRRAGQWRVRGGRGPRDTYG